MKRGTKKITGDVHWYVPGKKKPVAYSTKAVSDFIVVMAQEYDTIQEIHDAINYDIEAKEIMQKYIDFGLGSFIAKEMFS